MLTRYEYDGPVIEFQRVIMYRWKSSTLAKTPERAYTNLKYQFKKEHNKYVNNNIQLPGKLIEIV